MKSNNLVVTLCLSSILTFLFTVGLYIYQFGTLHLSDKGQDWVIFSDYFSGIIEPIIAGLNLLILTYISIKLIKIEGERNSWTLQELARPYANILFLNSENTLKISIHNVGLGPMIITDFTLFDDFGNTFNNFYDLTNFINLNKILKFNDVHPMVDSFEINSKNGAIGKDDFYCIFKIYFDENKIYNNEYLEYIKEKLNNYTLSISYSDIYDRPIATFKEKLYIKPRI